MSDEAMEQVKECMQDLDFSGLLSMSIKMEDYFDILRGIMEDTHDWQKVFVSASMPHRQLFDILESLGVDTSTVRPIDCVSFCVLGDAHGDALYVESPAIPEKVLMALEVTRREAKRPILVVIDSFNTFSLHNDFRIMSAFLQILAHRLKSNGDVGIVLSLQDQSTEETENLLRLISERTATI